MYQKVWKLNINEWYEFSGFDLDYVTVAQYELSISNLCLTGMFKAYFDFGLASFNMSHNTFYIVSFRQILLIFFRCSDSKFNDNIIEY